MNHVKIRWLGHGSFYISGSGLEIYLDPWITENPKCPMSIDDIVSADYICVTHGHIDHIGNTLELTKKTGAKLVCNPEIGMFAAQHGIEYDLGSRTLNYGGSMTADNVCITMVDALHSSDITDGGTVVPGSGCCGYIVQFEDGPNIYFAGDTGVFSDMALIAELYNPHVSIIPIGGQYTMGLKEAVRACRFLQSEIVIPMHYDTFRDQSAHAKTFKEQVEKLLPPTQVLLLKQGEYIEYPVAQNAQQL